MVEQETKAIVIHGGAGAVNMFDQRDKQNLSDKTIALARIVSNGWKQLEANNSALEVVTSTVMQLENDPAFNAGIGAAIGLGRDGEPLVSLDASIMFVDEEGSICFGGVTGVTNMANPILAAREVIDTGSILLHGEGANDIAAAAAEKYAIPPITNEMMMTDLKLERFHAGRKTTEGGTIGVVVFDGTTIVAGTSTGGRNRKDFGRTGDSCVPGKGTYANRLGGASATGNGEKILIHGTTEKAVELLNDGKTPQEAAELVSSELERIGGNGGIILLDRLGRIGVATNSTHMPNARMSSRMSLPRINVR